MVALFNSAETTTAVGTAVTTGNQGFSTGDPFDQVIGGGITLDNTHCLGTRSYMISDAASSQQLAWTSAKLGTVSELWGRMFLWYNATPNTPIGLIRPTTGGSQAARIRMNNDGTLTLADGGNAAEITTASALPSGQWVRIEWHIQFVAAGATVELKTFNNYQQMTVTENLSASAGGIGVNCDTVQFGAFVGGSYTFTAWMDGIAVHNDSSIGFLGPYRLPQFARVPMNVPRIQASVI